MAIPPWRLRLQPASYKGVQFHVEVGTRNSGRRIALHEFPKRDIPYAEDMGRKAKRFSVIGYVIGPTFEDQRDALIAVLDDEGNGLLVLPTSFDQKTVVVDGYSVIERREQGGYAEIEMTFIEAGQDPWQETTQDTQGATNQSVDSAVGSVGQSGSGQTALDSANTFISLSNPNGVFNSTSGSTVQDVANTFMQSSDISSLSP